MSMEFPQWQIKENNNDEIVEMVISMLVMVMTSGTTAILGMQSLSIS